MSVVAHVRMCGGASAARAGRVGVVGIVTASTTIAGIATHCWVLPPPFVLYRTDRIDFSCNRQSGDEPTSRDEETGARGVGVAKK